MRKIVRSYRKSLGSVLARARKDMSRLLGPLPTPSGDPASEAEALIVTLLAALRASEKRLADRTQHLQMLYDVSEQFNQQLPLGDLIRVAVESIWQAAEIDFVAVVLGEDELGPFRYAGIRGVDDPLAVLDQECVLPLWGVLAQALVSRPENGEPDYLIVQDIAVEGRPKPSEFPWASDTGCFMVIPLRHGNKTMGAMLLGSRTPYYFDEPSLCHYLYALAGNTTRAIQETQSRQQSNRWIKQLVSLQVLTRTITRTQRLNAIVEALNNELEDLFNDVTVRILLNLRDEELETPGGMATEIVLPDSAISLHLYTSQPLSQDERQFLFSAAMTDLVRWVMEAEQPLFLEPSAPIEEAGDLYYRSSGRGMLVPIGEALGVILVLAPDRAIPFEEGDMIVMRTIANSAAIAIGNARLYQQLSRSNRAGSLFTDPT